MDRQKKKGVDIDKIRQWIVDNTEKMLKFKELNVLLEQEEDLKYTVE
jgi:hypothetical protein